MPVVKPLSYSQEAGSVHLRLPSDWDGPSGVVVEVDVHNTRTLLSTVLSAIRASGDREAIEVARMTCMAILGR
jgi:hypothetical protein